MRKKLRVRLAVRLLLELQALPGRVDKKLGLKIQFTPQSAVPTFDVVPYVTDDVYDSPPVLSAHELEFQVCVHT